MRATPALGRKWKDEQESRMLDHGLPRAATPQPKLPLLHRMEERVGRGGSFETEETLGMPLPMNHPSPGLRPPSPRKAGRGQGEGRPARGSRAQGAIKVRGVLSSVLSPLLRRGERKKKTALRKIVAGRDDSFLKWYGFRRFSFFPSVSSTLRSGHALPKVGICTATEDGSA